jgi:signal peptidase I
MAGGRRACAPWDNAARGASPLHSRDAPTPPMNFALILFLLTVVTGVVWLLDRLVLARRRAPGQAEPWWVEYPKSFFPVLLAVFLLRSFIAEPFRIPSSSMRPTLVVGDYILVNKFSYGIRLPIVERKIVDIADPQRGDVVVFRYPVNPSQDFIKRVVGVGGDTIEYRDKQLTVNGRPLPQQAAGSYSYLEGLRFETTERRLETVSGESAARAYTIAAQPQAAPVYPANVRSFPGRENCEYNERGFRCRVPAGHYFMMGDNRDASDDSRYWGFVPDDHIRGRAFFIWFNWDDIVGLAFQRVGSGIR